MKKKLTMLMAGMLLSGGAAFAQTQVKGVVVSDEDGQPVIGATVRVVGTNAGAVTDIGAVVHLISYEREFRYARGNRSS